MKLHFKIKHWVTLYTILLVATMASVLVSLGYYEISHTLYQQILSEQSSRMRVAWILLQQEGSIELRNGKLYAGQTVLNGNSAIVDQITALVGGTATIFQGEIRIATNVRLPDGSRAIGTRLAKDKANKTLFKSHQNYRGETLILGEPYVTAYDLIRDPQGKVIGILQVGAWKSAYDQTLSNVLKRSLIVALFGILFIGIIVYGALRHLTSHLQEIAQKSKMLLESTGEGIYGVSQGAVMVFNDITSRKQAEAQIRETLRKVGHNPHLHQ